MPSRHVNDVVGPSLRTTRRDLPHWQLGGSTYFITFRLKGSWPLHAPAGTACTPPGSTGFQPVLAPQERQAVKKCILHWHAVNWQVHALTVMPDHVHILARPLEKSKDQWHSLSVVLRGVKRQSARAINRLRSRRGPLWQPESFDRIVRDEKEFQEKANYILGNAVKAGLVEDGWLYDGFWCEGMSGMPSAG